jgi:hypothetical protein
MNRFLLKITVVAVLALVVVAVVSVGLLRNRQTEQVSQLRDVPRLADADTQGPSPDQIRYDSKMSGPLLRTGQTAQRGGFSDEQL